MKAKSTALRTPSTAVPESIRQVVASPGIPLETHTVNRTNVTGKQPHVILGAEVPGWRNAAKKRSTQSQTTAQERTNP